MAEQTNESVPRPLALPDNANLEWLRKQAKRQLAELRASQSDAKLADAQFSLAKSYGFSSWRALKAHIDSRTLEGQLVNAVHAGDTPALIALLDTHHDAIDVRIKPHGWTLLHVAAHAGQLAVANLLLDRGLSVGVRESGDETTPLFWAAAGGHLDVVKRLIAANADVNASGDDHELGVIGWATCWDECDDDAHRAIVDVLTEHGARHHIFSAIAFALGGEVRRIVNADRATLDQRMSPFENRQTPLQFAVRKNQREMVNLLLELGADPLTTDGEGMLTAVYALTPNADRAVMRAIRARQLDAHNLNARLQGFVASIALAEWDDAARQLRDDAHLLNEGALHLMAKRGDTSAVRWLLAQGANPNALWGHWDAKLTAMHLAAWQGHSDIVRLLLDAGGDPAIHDSKHDGDVAGWAEQGGHPEIVAMITAR